MAPARTSSRRSQAAQISNAPARPTATDSSDCAFNAELFLEPMMGTPLAMYIEKDVTDRDQLVEIVTVSVP